MDNKPTRSKTSENARAVAHEVIDSVRKGKKISISGIMLKHGYSESSARALKVKQTATFKDTIHSLLEGKQRLEIKFLEELERKVETADFKSLNKALARLTCDIFLLERTVKKTENSLSEDEKKTIRALLSGR